MLRVAKRKFLIRICVVSFLPPSFSHPFFFWVFLIPLFPNFCSKIFLRKWRMWRGVEEEE